MSFNEISNQIDFPYLFKWIDKKAAPINNFILSTISNTKALPGRLEDVQLNKHRVSLLSWVIVPIMILWISINYIVGSIRQPDWQSDLFTTSNATYSSTVAASTPKQIKVQTPATQFYWKGSGVVSFWFDDAWQSQYSTAFPILEDSGYKAALAVPTKLIDNTAYMSWPQVRRLYAKGWQIDPHSRTHTCSVENLKPVQLDSEILGSRQDLEMEGIPSDDFIYVTPCGASTQDIYTRVKKNYIALRTSDISQNQLPITDPYNLKVQVIENKTTVEEVKNWLNDAREGHTWLILTFHQVDGENAQFTVSPENFKQMVLKVKESGLPVVLPRQVLQMVIDKQASSTTKP